MQNANLRGKVSFFLETPKGKGKIFAMLLIFYLFCHLGL